MGDQKVGSEGEVEDEVRERERALGELDDEMERGGIGAPPSAPAPMQRGYEKGLAWGILGRRRKGYAEDQLGSGRKGLVVVLGFRVSKTQSTRRRKRPRATRKLKEYLACAGAR